LSEAAQQKVGGNARHVGHTQKFEIFVTFWVAWDWSMSSAVTDNAQRLHWTTGGASQVWTNK